MGIMMAKLSSWMRLRAQNPSLWRIWSSGNRWYLRLEFQPADLWAGVYWREGSAGAASELWRWDIWVCLIPTLPLHLTHLRPRWRG